MANWDGFFNSNFLQFSNWAANTVPDENTSVVIDSTGNGASVDPTLSSGQIASVFTLEHSARVFTIEGSLSVNAGATLSGTGNLEIVGGTFSVSGSNGLAVTGGALVNNGTVNSTLQISGGIVDNYGVMSGPVTISGGLLFLLSGVGLSDSAALTVNGGTVNVYMSENVGLLTGTAGEIYIDAPHVLTVGDVDDSTFAGLIAGGGGLTKDGSGTLTLTGDNTYFGTTTISAGTLQIGAGGETGSLGTGAVVNNGALVFDRSGFNAVGNAISGTGTLTVTGGVNLNLLGTNTYSGTTTINAMATLQVSNYGTTGTLGSGDVTNNGILAFTRNDDLTVANVISGSGSVGKFGDGTLILSGANTYSGDTQVYFGILDVTGSLASNVAVFGGTLRVDGAAIANTATVTLLGSGNLTLALSERIGALSSASANSTVTLGTRTLFTGDAGDDTFAGVISGTGGLTKLGTGTFTLTGDNTYSGTTTISAGTLQIGAGGETGSLGTGAVVNNGALVFDRSGINSVANAISGTGRLTVTGGDLLVLMGTNTYSGTTTINAGGALQVGSYGTTGTLGTGAVTNNGQLAFARNDNLTVANVILGSGFVSNFGSGTLILSGASTYTGQTNVNTGVLDITGSIASQSVNVNGGTLRVDGSAISNTATVTLNNSGNLTLTGNEQIGALASGSATTTVTLGANTLTTSNDGGEVFAGVISGIGGLTIAGTSGDGLALTGTNTYGGLTTINSGAYLRLGNGGTTGGLGNGAIVNDGVLELFRSNGIVLDNAISGTGILSKIGAGTLTLSGTSTMTGDLSVFGGTVSVTGSIASQIIRVNNSAILRADAGALSDTATVILRDSGNLTLTGSETIGALASSFATTTVTLGTRALTTGDAGDDTFAGVISGTGRLNKQGTGTFTLTGDNTYSGITAINAGTLKIGAGGATGSLGSGAVVNNGALVFDRSGTTFVGNAISGTGTLTVTGGDGIVLTGTNSYSGTTTINAGGTLQLGVNGTTGTLGTGAVTNNGQLNFSRSDNLTVANVISGTGIVTKFDGGTLILSGASTYTGQTNVNSGILDITGSLASQSVNVGTATLRVDGLAISNTATVTLLASGNMTLTGNERIGALASGSATTTVTLGANTLTTGDAGNDTYAGVISGTGGLIKAGTGTFTLTGDNTYSGLTTVSAGTLIAASDSALGSAVAGTSVAGGATLALTGEITVAEAITLTGTGVGNGGALRNLSGSNAVNGAITLAGATRINVDAGRVDINGDITGTKNLTVGGTGTTFIAGDILTGTGSLTVDTTTGTGIAALLGTNTFTGGTTVNSGFLQLFGGSALADGGALTVNAPGTVQVFAGETVGALSGNGTVMLQTTDALVAGAGTSTTFSGRINEFGAAGAFTKLGTGTLTLSGANAFTGVTTVAGGVLDVTGSVASFNTVVNATGTLRVDGASLLDTSTVTLNGNGILDAAGDLELIAGLVSASTTSSVTLGANTLVLIGDGDGLLGESRAFAGVISGSGGLFKTGTDIQVLSSTNTYTGNTTVAGGELRLTGSIASQSVTVNGGTLRVDGAAISNAATVTLNNSGNMTLTGSERIGALASGSADSTVTLRTRTLTTGDAGNDTFAGVISGTGGLTKAGTGTFTLTGFNTYSGITTISAGTLQVGAGAHGGELGTGAVANNGALVFDRSSISFVDNAISGTGTLTVTGGDVLILTGTNSYSGTTTINADGILGVGGYGTTGTLGTVAVTNNGQLRFSRSDDLTVANQISGSGIFNKGGGGTLLLSGASTYTGQTFVVEGQLDITGSIASQSVEVFGTATLRVDGAAISNTATVTLNDSGNMTLAGSETIGGLVAGSATVSVNLAGNHLTLAAQAGGLGAMTFNGSAGIDQLSITLAPTLANFSLVGVNFTTWTEGTDIVTVNGNALANRLTGNAGNNRLDGGIGADTLLGGAGNDTYFVDASGDRVFETTTTISGINAGGSDTVQSLVNFDLDANAGVSFVENLTLTGTANIIGTGNALANRLIGNTGNNTLNGRLGADTMTGGAGADSFVFNTALGGGNIDEITDFSLVDDVIRLENAVFTGLAGGALVGAAFAANLTGEATLPSHQIIYESDTGRLFFDADGVNGTAGVEFAVLSAGLALTSADFFVF